MDYSEKVAAVKKVYADIILNTTKEAANRVATAEKKALGFLHDLCTTKNEAHRMLVRLKQMVDAKTIEAEITSSSQQSKIDVLEEQLQEAEGVIVDLRAELKWVREKLEKARNKRIQSLNEKTTEDNGVSCQNTTPESTASSNFQLQTLTTSSMKSTILDQRILNDKCNNATEQMEQSSVSNSENYSSQNADLASAVMREKEPELYRNGCTQRVRAWEGNTLARKIHLSGEAVIQHFLTKDALVIKENHEDEGKRNVPSPKSKNMGTMKSISGEEARKPVKVHTLRQRKNRFRKAKAKHRFCSIKHKKPYQPPSIISHRKTLSAILNFKMDEHSHTMLPCKTDTMDMKNSSEMKQKLLHRKSCFMDEKMIVHDGKGQRNLQSSDAISTSFTSHTAQNSKFCQPSSLFSHSMTQLFSHYGNAKSGGSGPKLIEDQLKMMPFTRLDPGKTLIKGSVDPISGSANVIVSVKALNRSGVTQNTADKEAKLLDELAKKECDAAAANSRVLGNESNSEVVNVPLVYSALKDPIASEETLVNLPLAYYDLQDPKTPTEPDISLCQMDNNRLFRYTFHRKRKKELLGSPDKNTSPERTIPKTKAGEKQNDPLDPQKPSLLNKLSRDGQQIALVAHQVGKGGSSEGSCSPISIGRKLYFGFDA